jgi:hypothetical protein
LAPAKLLLVAHKVVLDSYRRALEPLATPFP